MGGYPPDRREKFLGVVAIVLIDALAIYFQFRRPRNDPYPRWIQTNSKPSEENDAMPQDMREEIAHADAAIFPAPPIRELNSAA